MQNQHNIFLHSQQSDQLLSCIRSIKDKFKRNQYFRVVACRPAQTIADYQQKIRAMQIAFDSLVEENREISRLQNNYSDMLKDKDNIIQMKDIEIKKYRDQLLQATKKNQQLGNYSRQLALQYHTLLNYNKYSDETAFQRQSVYHSKLTNMENQVAFLRQKILNKDIQTIEVTQTKSKKINRSNSCKSTQKQNRTSSKKKVRNLQSKNNRKSFIMALK